MHHQKFTVIVKYLKRAEGLARSPTEAEVAAAALEFERRSERAEAFARELLEVIIYGVCVGVCEYIFGWEPHSACECGVQGLRHAAEARS